VIGITAFLSSSARVGLEERVCGAAVRAGEINMLTISQLETLSQMASPLLTLYVHRSLVDSSLHGLTPEHQTWLKNESHVIAASLPPAQRQVFSKHLERVEEFLQQRPPHERSLVIFAGPAVWKVVSLRREVPNELHWGKPALAQLFWLVGEHKSCGIVVVDHAGARFFHYWLGELVESAEKKFAVDVSQWKKKDLGHVTGESVRKTRGSQRDVFEKRMDSQYARLCRETAQQAASFCTQKQLAAVFLAGPDRLIKPIEEKFPRGFPQPVVLFDQDLARVTPHELLKHIEPQIAGWEHKHQEELVAAVIGDKGETVGGFDETLARLQKGTMRSLVLAQGLDATLQQCLQCGWTDRSADPVCSVCGGERHTVALRDVLPELVLRHHIEIQVVSNGAADGLKEAEGMAGWLRQPRRASARSAR
jgi:hypothetical protein